MQSSNWWYVTANGQWIATFYSDMTSMLAILGAIKSFPGVTKEGVRVWAYLAGVGWHEGSNVA